MFCMLQIVCRTCRRSNRDESPSLSADCRLHEMSLLLAAVLVLDGLQRAQGATTAGGLLASRRGSRAPHGREWWWNEATATTMPNGELAAGCDRETIRAYHAMYFACCYWPMDEVEEFVREGWARWVREEPEWFTKEWRARVPPEFIPGRRPTPE